MTNRIQISLFYLFGLSVFGVLLRSFPFSQDFFSVPFKNIIHAHSHLAMMGWVFNAVIIGFTGTFLPQNESKTKGVNLLFWIAQVCVLCMTVAFWIQGYGLYSIAFSTLHVLVSYALFTVLLREDQFRQNPLAVWTFIFFVLSTLGPFSLGVISAQGLTDSPVYKAAIYWFLHFSYNGWMTFALLCFIEKEYCLFDVVKHKKTIHVFALSIIATYVLSLLEFKLHWVWQMFAFVFAIILTLFAAVILRRVFQLKSSDFTHFLIKIAVVCFLVKTIMQVLSAIPSFNDIAFHNRNTLILYLHLVFIGWISVGFLATISKMIIFKHKTFFKWSVYALISGFALQEIMLGISLFLKTISAPIISNTLLLGAIIMAVGTFGVFITLGFKSKQKTGPITFSRFNRDFNIF